MKQIKVTLCLIFTMLTTWSYTVQAEDKQLHEEHKTGSTQHSGHGEMSHDSEKMFLEKREIDGYTVSFHVMEAHEGMRHGGSHNFMIKIEKNGKALDDVVINSKVIFPNGKDQSKALMRMDDWYMNGYDLGKKGKHQMMILFKTSDGIKHKGGVYYLSK